MFVEEIKELLRMTMFAVEGLHGKPAARLSVSYLFDEDAYDCVITGNNEIARQAALIFTQFLSVHYREYYFTMSFYEYAEKPPEAVVKELMFGDSYGGDFVCNKENKE
jgi:hypothetical protein